MAKKKTLHKKIKDADNTALLIFALVGLILNEVLDMSLDTTAIQGVADYLINLL